MLLHIVLDVSCMVSVDLAARQLFTQSVDYMATCCLEAEVCGYCTEEGRIKLGGLRLIICVSINCLSYSHNFRNRGRVNERDSKRWKGSGLLGFGSVSLC